MLSLAPVIHDPEVVSQATELVRTLVLGVLGLLFTLVSAGLVWLRTRISTWVSAKVEKAKADAETAESTAHYEALRCFTETVGELAARAVDEVEQTMVRDLKENKKWSVDTAREARDTAVEIMVRHAGELRMERLQRCSGLGQDALVDLFRTYVESKIRRDKSSEKPAGLGAKSPVVPLKKPGA